MASTYSSLKFELIGTGEQDGSWGTTTNLNLGVAINEAIAGRANAVFGVDSDLTLTLTNTNSTQVARHYILNVTSSVSLSTTRNLIVPAISKPYIIENRTTGGQSIIVKTASGTGVTVANNKRLMVHVDGTNVVASNDLPPGSVDLTSTTVTGTLPASSGGTGRNTLATGNVVIGNGASAVNLVPPGTAGNILTSNGSTWQSVTPTPGQSIPLPLAVSSGGTERTSLTANNLLVGNGTSAVNFLALPLGAASGGVGRTSLTANNLLVGNGTSAVNFIAPGSSGNVLTSNGTTWSSTALPAPPSSLGVGQTWQDLTASRVGGSQYQNTTGRAIAVALYGRGTSTTTTRFFQVSTNASTWVNLYSLPRGDEPSRYGNVFAVIPPNHYYRVDAAIESYAWSELR